MQQVCTSDRPESSHVDASIVICTRNRAEKLHQTLQSLAAMRTSEGRQFEIVLVDNGSTDATAETSTDVANLPPDPLYS